MIGIPADLVGQKFGKLLVLEKTDKRLHNSIMWKCICDCGNTKITNTKFLTRGAVKSCGCLPHNRGKNSKIVPIKVDLTGKVFGKLKVISVAGVNKHSHRTWNCLCECGNSRIISTNQLNSGKHKSCGCFGVKSGNRRGKDVYNFCGYEDISGTKWGTIKFGATVRNLVFEIDKEFIWNLFEKQNRKCALSGLDISYKENTASVDRIDNSIGYTKENVWLVHKKINIMRMALSVDEFISFCKSVANYNK